MLLAGSIAFQAENGWQRAKYTVRTEHLSAMEPLDRPSNAAQAYLPSLASDRKGTWEKQSLLYLRKGKNPVLLIQGVAWMRSRNEVSRSFIQRSIG